MSSIHQRAKDLFLQALSQPDTDRDAFLKAACGEDVDLRHEVESLLAFHQEEQEDLTPGPGPETVPARFAPGDLFAGRYRMITRLGRGGMGEVWRADDVVLEAPVALKLISSADADARDRVLNEVRLARQITHPSVCRVFDVGEAGGDVFFSMELVEGENLASLLRRVGRLPSERVIDIARQLCAGLAAAHAQGVLHRDLKPANVLIDDDGAARITDFGIATNKSRTDRKVLIGTPGYMAPEQMIPGGRLSERTDIYALGTVLYELVVGQHPFSRSGTGTQAPRPSTLVPDVDPNLERVIMRALAVDPQDRPASANAMAEALPMRSVLDGRKTRRWFIGAAVAAGIAVAAIAGSFFLSRGAPVLTEQDVIVLADFMNTTGEPVFDGTLKVALAVALEQSPFLKVFPDERVHETLRFMKRSPTEGVTRAVAREIAQRERLKALIAGSIGRLGRNYVLALEAVNAETGDVMARQQVEVADKEQVLTALGQAASKLREKLGESLASIQRFDVPLPRATTASLDALAAYSLALDDGRVTPRLAAIPHLKRAIELDPNFALALALLSGVYANTDQTALAPEFSRKAFELRDRVSERERFFISWRYYRDATQAWDKALELAQSWVETYPREAFAFNSLGSALLFFGRYDQAIEPFRHALQLDPKFAPLYSNLASAYMALNRFDEAKAILQEGVSRQLDFNGFHRIGYLLAFIDGDSASMTRHLEASIGVGRTNAAYGWQAHASAFGGRQAAAHEHFRRGIDLAVQGGFREVAAQLSIEDAETHAVVGQCPQALKEVQDGLALSRDNFSLERASRALALCGADGQVAAIKSELMRRFPEATLTLRVSLPTSEALLATSHDEWARALKLLEPVRVYENTPWAEFWAPYLRGQAHLHLHDGPHAAEEFQTILNHRGQAPVAQLYSLAYLGLARADAMSGANERASEAYDRFLALWSEADANLGVLTAARQEQSRLRANLHE